MILILTWLYIYICVDILTTVLKVFITEKQIFIAYISNITYSSMLTCIITLYIFQSSAYVVLVSERIKQKSKYDFNTSGLYIK